MRLSVGIDVVPIERLRVLLAVDGMAGRLFTPAELSRCAAKPDPVRSLAGILAAKEATMKALGLRSLPAWARRIEVTFGRCGSPSVAVEGMTGETGVSITHDGGLAIAVTLQSG